MTNELAVLENVNGTSLEAYRARDEIRELAERLLKLHPAADEVGKGGMLAVAQLALMIGASPLPGTNEIHVWKNKDRIQFQLGINFYRRKASEKGGILWQLQPRQMREAEREEYGVPNGMIAAICKGVRASDMAKYIDMGFKANQIWDMAGRTGIGTCRTDEGKVGRTPVWTALKRAEVDLCRALFPAMMAEVLKVTETIDVEVEAEPVVDTNDWDDADWDDALGFEDSPTASLKPVEVDEPEEDEPNKAEAQQEPLFDDADNGAYEEAA